MINIPKQQIQGAYHRRIGDIVVTAISDGFLDGSMQVLRNISPEEATGILTASFRPARRTSVNAFLIYSAGRLALVDTGSGTYLQPTAGKVLANIKAIALQDNDRDTLAWVQRLRCAVPGVPASGSLKEAATRSVPESRVAERASPLELCRRSRTVMAPRGSWRHSMRSAPIG